MPAAKGAWHVLPLVAIGALLATVIRMSLDVIPSPTLQKRLSLHHPVRKRGIIKRTPPLPLTLHKAAGEWRYGVFEEPRPSPLPNIPPFPLPSVGGEPARLLIAMIYNCGMTGLEMDSRGRESCSIHSPPLTFPISIHVEGEEDPAE